MISDMTIISCNLKQLLISTICLSQNNLMKPVFYIFLFLTFKIFHTYGQQQIENMVFPYKRHLISDSTIVKATSSSELELDSNLVIPLTKVFHKAQKRDKHFHPINTTVELVYYQKRDKYTWMLQTETLTSRKSRGRMIKIKAKYMWINQKGKIIRHRREYMWVSMCAWFR